MRKKGDICFWTLHLIRIRFNNNELHPKFAGYLLNSKIGRQYIEKSATTSAGNYNINTSQLRGLTYARPPLEEQRRILLIASNQDLAIDIRIQKNEKLKSLKAALMQDLLTGKVRVTPLLSNSKETSP
ncbi:MAG: restriction endonuclease subunit S [Bacteroidales bacterium]|nr:restriction endonuclease subunit S [Candidatus Latescibacterota bacterium]